MVLLRLLISGPLHSLLGPVKDQRVFLLEGFGKLRGIVEFAFRQAISRLQRRFQDLQAEFLIPLRIGGVQAANEPQQVVG